MVVLLSAGPERALGAHGRRLEASQRAQATTSRRTVGSLHLLVIHPALLAAERDLPPRQLHQPVHPGGHLRSGRRHGGAAKPSVPPVLLGSPPVALRGVNIQIQLAFTIISASSSGKMDSKTSTTGVHAS